MERGSLDEVTRRIDGWFAGTPEPSSSSSHTEV
jgi:hypothetical protein